MPKLCATAAAIMIRRSSLYSTEMAINWRGINLFPGFTCRFSPALAFAWLRGCGILPLKTHVHDHASNDQNETYAAQDVGQHLREVRRLTTHLVWSIDLRLGVDREL